MFRCLTHVEGLQRPQNVVDADNCAIVQLTQRRRIRNRMDIRCPGGKDLALFSVRQLEVTHHRIGMYEACCKALRALSRWEFRTRNFTQEISFCGLPFTHFQSPQPGASRRLPGG